VSESSGQVLWAFGFAGLGVLREIDTFLLGVEVDARASCQLTHSAQRRECDVPSRVPFVPGVSLRLAKNLCTSGARDPLISITGSVPEQTTKVRDLQVFQAL
jgi:hypothetical protein